jgi:acyl carrier protein
LHHVEKFMTEDDMIGLIAEALEVPPGSLSLQTEVAAVDEWGSLGWLTLMSILDERHGVSLSTSDIDSIAKVSDLAALLRSRGVIA